MNMKFMTYLLISSILMCGSTNLLAQNTGDVKREILEEVLEEKKKGITIPSGERDNTEVGIGAESFIHCSKWRNTFWVKL